MRLREITEGTTAADKILLIALILISASGFIFIKKAFPQGSDVGIEVNGKPVYRLPLDKDATVRVSGISGDTIVEIKNRKVRIKESACLKQICVHNGWIDRGAIICLPNKIIVSVGSDSQREDKQDKTIDAITG